MVVCVVPGCGSNSNVDSNYTYHRLPRALIPRARWVIALGPMSCRAYVCSRHFPPSMFTMRGKMKTLSHNAVPKLFLEPVPEELRHPSMTFDLEPGGEVVACRVCLAAGGRLYAISGSGLEDELAALTGVMTPEAGRWPRHLCAFCRAKLSKCAAFRDSCRRSTALLQTLAERGPLKMNDIRTIDRSSHKLANVLAYSKVFQIGTDSLLEVTPLIKTEREDKPNEIEHIDVQVQIENFEGGLFIKNDPNFNFEIPVEKQKPDLEFNVIPEIVATKPEIADDVETDEDEVANDGSGTDVSEETEDILKKVELVKRIPVKTTKPCEMPPRIDMKAFEERYNVEYKVMSKEEQKKEIEDRKSGNTSRYCCDMCGRGYNREQAMVNHMWSHDPRLGPLECGVCRQRFRHPHLLRRHRCQHRDRFRCRECGLLTRDRTRAKAHCRVHQGSSHACPYCSEAYVRKASYFNHIRTAHPERNEACDECGETFLSALGVRQHKRLAHRPIDKAALKCKDCGVKFLNAEALQKHLDLSSGRAHAAPWPCAACGDSCGSEAARQQHQRDKHPPDQHHCDVCDITFRDASSFSLHVERKHLGRRAAAGPFRRRALPGAPRQSGRQFVCELCGLAMHSAQQLDYHHNSHFGIKPVSCPVCHKKFTNKSNLKCNKTFSNASSFALHVERKHKNQRAVEAPFRPRPGIGRVRSTVCEICGKVYQNLTMLQYHMNGHLAVKPFQCPHCPKAFTHQSNHRLHMRVHTGERPYQCEQCPLAFSRRGNFTKHMKNVHLRVQVKCDTCGKMVGAGSLASHVRAVHLRQPYVRRKRNRNADKKLLLGAES